MAFKAVEGAPSLTSSDVVTGQSTEAMSGKGAHYSHLCSPVGGPTACPVCLGGPLCGDKGQVGDLVAKSDLSLVPSAAQIDV